MQFQTLEYFLFLFAAITMYWFLPTKYRKVLLVIASFFFYCWYQWEYGFLLAFVITNTFYLTKCFSRFRKKWIGLLAILLNVGVLGYFKYYMFLVRSINETISLSGTDFHFSTWDIFLPLGVSFFTFQAMSYTFDVMQNRIGTVKSLRDFALYVIFWPQLIAGPIMRVHELLPQFNTTSKFNIDNLKFGVRRIINGLFLKLVLADNISYFVDEGFRLYKYNSMLDNWSLAFAFGLQIYFDFAGYSSIAIGSARLLGINLTENFNFPYAAANPRVFWKNWHISLSSWVRDYLYVPFTGEHRKSSSSTGGIQEAVDGETRNAVSDSRRSIALFASWAIMGLWHGASWTFVCWGLWHAFVIQMYRWFSKIQKEKKLIGEGALSQFLGFVLSLMGIMMGWIFFRAESIGQSFYMLGQMFNFSSLPKLTYRENNYILLSLIFIGFYICYFYTKKIDSINKYLFYKQVGWVYRSIVYAVIIIFTIAYFDETQQFIYFQF